LVVVGVQLRITITLILPVTVVPVVVVPVVEPRMGVTVVKEVRGRRDKVTTVHVRGLTGTPLVVVVPVVWVTVEMVKVVKIINHMAVMV